MVFVYIRIVRIMPTYLGQHFLKNKKTVGNIITALAIKPGETVIEIGPGKGALTAGLLRAVAAADGKLIVIEIDRDLAVAIHEKYAGDPHLTIVNGDALTELSGIVAPLSEGAHKIVGNIPYYITGKLLRTIGDLAIKPERTILMIQKEVAERVAALPPKMNLLAAAVRRWADPKLLLTLTPDNFDPPPDVHSAVIMLQTRAQAKNECTDADYYRLLHIIFKQPRKTLLNNLADSLHLSKQELERLIGTLGYDVKTRPQELSVDRIDALATLLKDKKIEITPNHP